jgi:hypothetical protein
MLEVERIFLGHMANMIMKNTPPVGFFKSFVVEKSGEHKDEFNLKIKGIAPLTDAVRLFALEKGVIETSTFGRIQALKDKHSIIKEYSSELEHAFDFFMQFYSDRFHFDLATKRLVNQKVGELPSIHLSSPYYQEVSQLLRAFTETSIIDLSHLDVEGCVDFSSTILKGNVKVVNQQTDGKLLSLHQLLMTDQRLSVVSGRLVICDQEIIIPATESEIDQRAVIIRPTTQIGHCQ